MSEASKSITHARKQEAQKIREEMRNAMLHSLRSEGVNFKILREEISKEAQKCVRDSLLEEELEGVIRELVRTAIKKETKSFEGVTLRSFIVNAMQDAAAEIAREFVEKNVNVTLKGDAW